jgi:hypothetical protein
MPEAPEGERASSAATRLPARSLRRQARVQAAVLLWWHAMPEGARCRFYVSDQLAQATALPAAQLAQALRSLGWCRELVRIDGAQKTIWLPPGAQSVKRRVGRPSFTELARHLIEPAPSSVP